MEGVDLRVGDSGSLGDLDIEVLDVGRLPADEDGTGRAKTKTAANSLRAGLIVSSLGAGGDAEGIGEVEPTRRRWGLGTRTGSSRCCRVGGSGNKDEVR